jgi:hypothetical protein
VLDRSQKLAVVCVGALLAAQAHAESPRPLDARRLAAAGVRVLDGRYVQLATDLASSPAVDELPAVFDAAVPLWCEYFNIRESDLAGQRWTALVIDDRERFAALGLLPADNPNFVNGYARDGQLWLVEQPSDYYRRHLLLHEGTHAFMQTQLGGCGPGWHMEGLAELLATHHWDNSRLRLSTFPATREAVPMWGRIKLIRDAQFAGNAWPLEAVLAVDNNRALAVDSYAWTWALAALLDAHPQFRDRFRRLQGAVDHPQFTARFRKLYADDWDDLLAEWQAYVAQLDYGYDIPRMAMTHKESSEVNGHPRSTTIAADRGWQSTGWLLRAGRTYQVSASGRYQIAHDGQPWPCEPGGVTIEYYDSRPLGALLGALRPVNDEAAPPTFAAPMLIGLGATLTPQHDAVLYLRANDSPARLADNAGELTVRKSVHPEGVTANQTLP